MDYLYKRLDNLLNRKRNINLSLREVESFLIGMGYCDIELSSFIKNGELYIQTSFVKIDTGDKCTIFTKIEKKETPGERYIRDSFIYSSVYRKPEFKFNNDGVVYTWVGKKECLLLSYEKDIEARSVFSFSGLLLEAKNVHRVAWWERLLGRKHRVEWCLVENNTIDTIEALKEMIKEWDL